MHAPTVERLAWLLRPRIAWIALLAIVGSPSVRAASSTIVGFYNVSVPQGNSAWVSGLVGPDLYQGAAATVTADVDGKALVTFSSPGWAGGDFPLHYAEPQSGIAAGLALDVLSNTTDTLKLNTTPAAAGLSSGMVFIVRKHATLKGLIPDGGGLAPFEDTIALFGTNAAQTLYTFDNGNNVWITFLGQDSSNVIVRPGQGFVLNAKFAVTLTLGKGEVAYVKSTPTRIKVSSKAANLIGPLNPLGATTTLGALGIASSLDPFNDSVLTLNPVNLATTGRYLTDGSTFYNLATGAPSNGFSLLTGTGVVVTMDVSKNVLLAPVSVAP